MDNQNDRRAPYPDSNQRGGYASIALAATAGAVAAIALVIVAAVLVYPVLIRNTDPPLSPPVRARASVEHDAYGLLQRQIEERIATEVTKLREESKLVVATQTLDVTITRRETDKLFAELSCLPTLSRGTSTVSMRLKDNKVQHVIDPRAIRAEVRVDADRKLVIIHGPAPRVDTGLVEVQSDPDKLLVEMDMGWSHLESGRGKEMLRRIKKVARDEVVASARTADPTAHARNMGKHSLRETFEPVMEAIDGEIVVRVQYDDE